MVYLPLRFLLERQNSNSENSLLEIQKPRQLQKNITRRFNQCSTLKMTFADDATGNPTPARNVVSAAMHKLTKLVEQHAGRVSGVQVRVHSAAQKQDNEDSCLIYKLSNDAFGHIFGRVGKSQFIIVAGTTNRCYSNLS